MVPDKRGRGRVLNLILIALIAGCASLIDIEDTSLQPDAGTGPGMGNPSDGSPSRACGDEVLDPGEICDDGNTLSGDGCSADCLSDESCGNRIRDPGEGCDDGNQLDGDGCRANCQLENCGNGVGDPGEVCDDGNNVPRDGCSADCLSTEFCGNGYIDFPIEEQCDDRGESATCDTDCTLVECGDGVHNQSAQEFCDSGGVNTADCDLDCTAPLCGDNLTNTDALNTGTPADPNDREQCDAGGINAADCDVDCTLPACGDGLANPAALNTATADPDDLEQCDAGGINAADCDVDCTLPECGDGITNPNADNSSTPAPDDREQCDTGGSNTNACDFDCTTPSCGDGLANPAADEQCDDGNDDDGDLCSNACTRALTKVFTGERHTCALFRSGDVKCWGFNNTGQLGLGDSQNRGDTAGEMGGALPFIDVGTDRTVQSLAAGYDFSCALLDNGAIKCWGNGANGQLALGLGRAVRRGDEPGEMGDDLPEVPLGSGRRATSLAAGRYYACALLDNGAVKCWGDNDSGQLGQGDTDDRGDDAGEMGDDLPEIPLGSGRTAVALTAGFLHTCALLDNSTVKCWGSNIAGQLGQGDTDNRGDNPGELGNSLPAIDLGPGRSATAITAGAFHSCALLDNGAVKCWGNGDEGQLGLGDPNDRGDEADEMGEALPAVDLGARRTAVSLAAGFRHTCALLDNGAVKCWGQNNAGQLGQGDIVFRGTQPGQMGDELPAIALGTDRTAVALSAEGGVHTCALLSDGAIKCWGDNGAGQLGMGDTDHRGDESGEMGDSLAEIDLGAIP